MVFSTKAIVLRTVPYGETSVIVSCYTQAFGLQSYILNGVRTGRKTNSKGNLFQPASILDMEVYHNELKNLQRIKEVKWHYLYNQVFFNVYKNAVALFITELLQKVVRQPESNADLYEFIEDAYITLDKADDKIVANFPLYFAIHLTSFFGSKIQDNHTAPTDLLDLREGTFTAVPPVHALCTSARVASIIAHLLKIMQPVELPEMILNKLERRETLEALIQFYSLHIHDFGAMRSLAVLQEVLA
ncbi:MAG: DNA repair protein RecO [Sphingobacteriales bacterium]|nr:DNA repair protein RecO [Sphingobacteriales bacterium]OJY81118.1 MAG: DNA repair protein RecO [Sphingobacteriales bacterium 44-15]